MARLQLDQNVAIGLAPLLERAGHDAVVAGEVGAARWTDDALLLFAGRTGRVFITHNRRDFRLLHDAWTTWPPAFGMALPPHPGILVMDSAPAATLGQVINALLSHRPPGQLANAIFWWHRHDGWRQPIARAQWEAYRPLNDGQE